MLRSFLLWFLIFFLHSCGGLPILPALIVNTGGTVIGNAAWHEIKAKYPQHFPSSIENISPEEKEKLAQRFKEINEKYTQIIEEIERGKNKQ